MGGTEFSTESAETELKKSSLRQSTDFAVICSKIERTMSNVAIRLDSAHDAICIVPSASLERGGIASRSKVGLLIQGNGPTREMTP